VQNDALDKGQIEVTLKTIVGSRVLEEKKTIDVTAKGQEEVIFKTVLNRPEPPKDDKGTDAAVETTAIFELTVKAGEHSDVARQLIPLKPYGVPVYTTASGSSTSDTTAWVEPPKNMTLERPGLEIIVGPTVEQSLIDIVLGPAPWCQIEASRLTTGMDATTSDLMAALALQKLLGVSRDAASPQAQSLDVRVRASIGLLVSSQNDDGGWSWTGRGGASERHNTSRIVWALSTAKKAGYTVPEASHNKAVAYLQAQVAATAESDYESKAILLHALSAAGQGDFALANRLYRNRPSLSAGALVYLTLAFCEMDRKQTAGELLDLLVKQNFDDATARRTSALACLPWSQSPAELRALTALAIQEVKAKDAKAKELVDWLLAHRTGHRWSPDKATGPAAVALCRWFADSRFEGEKYKLTVFVNDVQVKVLDIDKTAETQTVVVPAALLKKTGKQQVNFQVTGRGRFTYQCVLGGFVPAEKLASTTQDWRVERTYQPAAIEVDGRDIPRGFAVLQGGYSTFKNPLTQLPVGRRGVVELEIWRHNVPANAPDEQLEYLVITEPIPNGATVIEKSVTGGFERFEIGPGAITFYVGNRQHPGTIRYELYGYLPGKYRAGPTVIRNAHRPEQLVVSKPKSLGVLPLGGKSADEYKLTPQELYELGKHFFNKKEMKTAGGHLAELLAKWNTNPDTYKHAVQMLLDVHLETGPAAQVVRYFEIVKEKWPAEEIPFAKIVKVGAAYHEMGEYERSFLIFRATVESSFLRESRVAGFLQAQGEFARSVSVMGRLLREYPPDGYTAAASYALAQQVYAKAPDAAADAGLRKLKINRVDLTRRAWTMFETFLTAYPDDPAADEAAFAAANTLLELKAYKEAVAACNQYATRYPKSDLLDSYWYLIGYCHFATSQNKEALEMCKKVAEAMRTDKTTGRQVESPNKWQAIYILGQVHHSLGEAAAAITEYRRVEDRFPDAKQSIDYFTRKAIELPEVTAVKPGAAAEVELKFRNIAACDAKVYRIDLMKFSLLKRNLGGITNINLAGIRPHHEATVALGEGKDYRDRTHKLPLPLKEEGAYLVVCRGDDLHASGLVLVSPLKVEVQEEAVSGRVRTTVKDDVKDQYLRNVHVKVIGARNDDFVSGATDLRGVFVADGIKGNSTVIAQVEPSRYAFFRGQTNLTTEEERKKEAEKADAKRASKSGKAAASPAVSLEDNLLENVKGYNKARQMKQVEQLQEMYKNVDEGVKAQKAF
jgi:tetratricopeptide (TPR) repeat protein